MKKLGFGGMRLPLLRSDDAGSIDQEQVNRMADAFLNAGFTYFDTAFMYHEELSEGAFKKALIDRYPRETFLLADKMPTSMIKGPQEYAPTFATQLERCGVEYFDYYLLHNLNRHTYQNTLDFGGFEYVLRLKAEGKIRHVGFSFHDTADMLDEILTRYPEMEFVQLQLNYVDWRSPIVQAQQCYETARKHGKPVIVMEPVKGGGLAAPPEEAEKLLKSVSPDASCASWALRYAASLDGVMMVLSGMSNMAQIEENIALMKDFHPLSQDERDVLEKAAELIISSVTVPCTNCRYCTDTCPKNLDIPGYFAIYNTYEQFRTLDHHKFQYGRQIVGRGKASECIGCKQCESRCPQHIEITDWLSKVAETFE